MTRNHEELKVFEMADALVVRVYRVTQQFPTEERFGLQSQIRRAAISVPTNIVEGSARASLRDYIHFLVLALSSASEARYLIDVAHRLAILSKTDHAEMDLAYANLLRAMEKMISALRTRL